MYPCMYTMNGLQEGKEIREGGSLTCPCYFPPSGEGGDNLLNSHGRRLPLATALCYPGLFSLECTRWRFLSSTHSHEEARPGTVIRTMFSLAAAPCKKQPPRRSISPPLPWSLLCCTHLGGALSWFTWH